MIYSLYYVTCCVITVTELYCGVLPPFYRASCCPAPRHFTISTDLVVKRPDPLRSRRTP